MNEVLNVIKNRYSCRSYTGVPVPQEMIEALAVAAVSAPSALNKQPWEIIVVKEKALIDEMNDSLMDFLSKQEDKSAYERMMSRGGKVFYNAPCMFVIAQKEGTDLDSGIVAENIALAASSLGLGNVICGMMRMVFSTENGEKYKKILIPEGYEFGMSVLVGYATEQNGTPHEPDTSKIKYIG
ncbi:MAG: nitroreductase family protein [Roseburia sp.]|nr:nitroreductase family protein [Roseburia sp.]